MFIATTININKKMFAKLSDAADALQISKSHLLSLLLLELIKSRKHSTVKVNQRVQYQKRSEQNNWHKLHVSLRCDVYEKALDLRKLLKFSVSFLSSLAIEDFLETVKEKLLEEDTADNYASQYVFIVRSENNLPSYAIYHYIPEQEILKKLHKKT